MGLPGWGSQVGRGPGRDHWPRTAPRTLVNTVFAERVVIRKRAFKGSWEGAVRARRPNPAEAAAQVPRGQLFRGRGMAHRVRQASWRQREEVKISIRFAKKVKVVGSLARDALSGSVAAREQAAVDARVRSVSH